MSRTGHLRRGATLIEAVVVVLVLAIAVPPTLSWLGEAAARRADSISVVRATALANVLIEQVMSDSVSSDIGLVPATYTDTATTGLVARMSGLSSFYSGQGFTWSLSFSGLLGPTLVATGDPTKDLYRKATVTVNYVDSSGTARALATTMVVAKP